MQETQATQVQEQQVATQADAQPKVRRIKDVMIEQIGAGASTQEVLAAIYAEFPNANSGPKDVAWYRYQLRKQGALPARTKLTPAERKAKKAAYEKAYKAKQQELKAARRAAALAKQD